MTQCWKPWLISSFIANLLNPAGNIYALNGLSLKMLLTWVHYFIETKFGRPFFMEAIVLGAWSILFFNNSNPVCSELELSLRKSLGGLSTELQRKPTHPFLLGQIAFYSFLLALFMYKLLYIFPKPKIYKNMQQQGYYSSSNKLKNKTYGVQASSKRPCIILQIALLIKHFLKTGCIYSSIVPLANEFGIT